MFGRLNGKARETIDVSLEKLAQIILLARAFDAELDESELDEEPVGANATGTQRANSPADNPLARELRDTIDNLSEDEQAVLVALAWIGRGDFSDQEFDQALSTAFERRTGSTADYLLGFPMLGDLLEQGAAVCGANLADSEAAKN
jgi:Protein of unknown function (DUF3775)